MRLIVLNPYFSIRGGVRHLLFLLVHGFHSLLPHFLFPFSVLGPGLGSDFILFYGVYPCWVILRHVLPFFVPPTHFSSSRLLWFLRGIKTELVVVGGVPFFSFLVLCLLVPFNGL